MQKIAVSIKPHSDFVFVVIIVLLQSCPAHLVHYSNLNNLFIFVLYMRLSPQLRLQRYIVSYLFDGVRP